VKHPDGAADAAEMPASNKAATHAVEVCVFTDLHGWKWFIGANAARLGVADGPLPFPPEQSSTIQPRASCL
jgi:hypothetical protein